jgi:hypothetical protein
VKVFIYKYLNSITEHYHDGGGVVVVAASPERAKELILEQLGEHGITDDDFLEEKYDAEKRTVVPGDEMQPEVLKTTKERVVVFPDIGCC